MGLPGHYDQVAIAKLLPGYIDRVRDELISAEELRAVIVRPMSTANLTPEVAPEVST
ncbi:MAG: hypothetical protein ABIZ30_10775 [Candidatus Limnocylindrales bacterium]